jgi:hypothetical protein
MSNVERMQKQKNTIQAVGIPCILTQNVSYTRHDGIRVVLNAGDKVHVDVERGIASAWNDYFTIEASEYQSLLLN